MIIRYAKLRKRLSSRLKRVPSRVIQGKSKAKVLFLYPSRIKIKRLCYSVVIFGLGLGVNKVGVLGTSLVLSSAQAIETVGKPIVTKNQELTKKLVYATGLTILVVSGTVAVLQNVQLRGALNSAHSKLYLASTINKSLKVDIGGLKKNITTCAGLIQESQVALESIYAEPSFRGMLSCISETDYSPKYSPMLLEMLGGKEIILTNGGKLEIIKLLCAIRHISNIALNN